MSDAYPTVVLSREFRATPERLFAIWTDPKLVRRWLAPEGYTVTGAELDARPGGVFRIEVTGIEGDTHITVGEYREVVPGARIVKSWAYSGDNEEADSTVSLATVEFMPASKNTTRMTLTHEGVPSEVGRENLRLGWASCFGKLAKVV